jgi:Rho GTPase-activating protein RGD1
VRPCQTHDVYLRKLDIDSVDLNADEWISDINNITGVLKLWLRELPEPLMTNSLQAGFVEAASARGFKRHSLFTNNHSLLENENDRLRHIRLHERVNDLPDANYSTLKYLMGHLYKYARSIPSLFFGGAHDLLESSNIIKQIL